MKNTIRGSVNLNNEEYDMNESVGYIEKDWGESFPDAWIWLQGNASRENLDTSFMFSLAKVPFIRMKFVGIICVLNYNGKEYRFATYNGTKTEFVNKTEKGTEITLKRGKYKLKIKAYSDGFDSLIAPTRNGMKRELFESVSGEIELELYERNAKILDDHLTGCGVEVSEIGDLVK